MPDFTLTLQAANVAELERVTANGGQVQAWAASRWDAKVGARVPEPATENCTNDELHGKAVAYFPGMDGGCLACAITALEESLTQGQVISVDVLA